LSIYAGIDVGGTSIKMGLFEDGTLIEKWSIKTRTEDSGAHVLSDIYDSLFEHIEAGQIEAIGIGLPGPVEDDRIVHGLVNIGWGEVDVKEASKPYVSCPVYAINDANAAALGEVMAGGAKGKRSAVMITIGTGIGGGIVIEDRLVTGARGAAGEIGHMPLVFEGGEYDTLEERAGALGIKRRTLKLIEEGIYKTSLKLDFEVRDVFDLAKTGDELCVKVVDEMSVCLGTALSDIACLIDPEVFVIGGGVADAGDFLLDKIRKVYVERAFGPCKETKIVIASLGNDAGIYGACKYAMGKE
jgi:glucokinase